MLAISMLTWWYTKGWANVLASLSARLRKAYETFSVSMLLRTLFSPWRRIISVPGKRLIDHLYATLDNLVSRFVGFFARLFVLIAALVSLVFILLVSLLELIFWPLLPVAVIMCLIAGFIKL